MIEPDVFMTIRISKSLRRLLKTRASELGLTVKQILIKLINDYLDNS